MSLIWEPKHGYTLLTAWDVTIGVFLCGLVAGGVFAFLELWLK